MSRPSCLHRPPSLQSDMPASAALLRSVRQLHLYIGTFISPALLFFAFTGALQTFSLHETTRGSSYVPPRWAVVLGQIHKKQTDIVPNRRQPPPEAKAPEARTRASRPSDSQGDPLNPRLSGAAPTAPTPSSAPPPEGPKRHPLPLKIFFLLVSIGLFTSTLTGIYMSYRYHRSPALITALLTAGALIPIALVFV